MVNADMQCMRRLFTWRTLQQGDQGVQHPGIPFLPRCKQPWQPETSLSCSPIKLKPLMPSWTATMWWCPLQRPAAKACVTTSLSWRLSLGIEEHVPCICFPQRQVSTSEAANWCRARKVTAHRCCMDCMRTSNVCIGCCYLLQDIASKYPAASYCVSDIWGSAMLCSRAY